MRRTLWILIAGLLFVPAWVMAQPVDPRTYPTADLSAVQAAGTWTFDWSDGAGGDISYGGTASGVSEDGRFLYTACNSAAARRGIAKLEIPAIGGRARVAAPCLGPDETEIKRILPGWGGGQAILGGVLEQGGRVVVAGYASYDANGATQFSHWSGPDLKNLSGPFSSTLPPGLVKGQMGTIPVEWRSLLGGPAFSIASYTSIISRQSGGPTFSVFDPATVTGNGFAMKMLLGCPYTIAKCQTWTAWGPSSNGFEGTELAGGTFIVPGTRSLIVVEREGTGGECYGYTTNDKSLHGQPYPSPEGVRYCYSLSDPWNQKGNKAYPYKLVAKLFDLNDLVAVKDGQKRPEDVTPYAVVDLPGSAPGEMVTSGAYDPATDRLHLLRYIGGGINAVHVYEGFGRRGTPPPPPPPVPTATLVANPSSIAPGQTAGLCWTTTGADSATITTGVGVVTPTAGGCVDVTPTQTTAYALTAPGAGGSVTVTATVTVNVPPPPPPPPAGFSGILRAQTPYTVSGLTVGLRLALQVNDQDIPAIPGVGAAVTLPLPLTDGTVDRRVCSVWKVEPTGYSTRGASTRVTVQCQGISGVRLHIDTAAPTGGQR